MSGMEKQHIEGDKISIRGARANNLKNIDRYNLDSNDDEKCLQTYMNLVKLLLIILKEYPFI